LAKTILLYGPEALAILRRFMDPREAGLKKAFRTLWAKEAGRFDDADLESLGKGILPISYLKLIAQTNTNFVNDVLTPAWRAGIEESSTDMQKRVSRLMGKKGGGLLSQADIAKLVAERKAILAGDLNKEVERVLNLMVNRYVQSRPMTPYELASMVESNIGLTEKYATAVANRYDALIADGYSSKEASTQASKYADFLRGARAENIARTELAEAYGEGQLQSVQNAAMDGLVQGEIEKSWMAAEDERTCPTCGNLDGEKQVVSVAFSNGKMRPPAHQQCRCGLQYEVQRGPLTT